MQSLGVGLGDSLVESLALGLSNLELESRGLAGAIGTLQTQSGQRGKVVWE